MKKIFNINSITVQLVIFTLIISIIPVAVVTYNTSVSLGLIKNAQFDDRLSNLAIISDQAYNGRVDGDNALACIMAKDYNLASAISAGDKIQLKRLVDRYASANPNVSVLDVTDREGNVIASASFIDTSCRISGDFITSSLEGNGMAGTDIIPASTLKSNSVDFRTISAGTPDGLGIICSQPIRDENNSVIGTVYLVELLNENTDLVDKIAAVAKGECTVFMGDIRIATSIKNDYNVRILGTKAEPGIAASVMGNGLNSRGYEDRNNQHIYINFEPLKNPNGKIVGMIAAGYDVNPSIGEINQLAFVSIAIGLLIAILSSIIGFVFVGRISHPINRLVGDAKRVAAGELETPLEVVADGSEIGELQGAIRKMMDSIKERINYNESILKSISDPMLVIDLEGRISFINEPASALTGYSLHQAAGQIYKDVFRLMPLNGITIDDCLKKQKVVRCFEGTLEVRDGKKVVVRGSCSPIRAADGAICGDIILLRDITKIKEADNQIKASLKEKELLLKEIHHRVKNNLQIISSLLSLQSSYVKDAKALNMFTESQNRVKSMALIHERLYQSKDFSRVDFGDYIGKLSGNLAHSYGINPGTVRLSIDAANISLGIDTAIPCGLIINELLTNALKYAFPGGRQGEIRITLHDENPGEKGRYILVVADNGVGLPSGFDPQNATTLGLQLVTLLVDQLNGTLAVNRESGTEFVITFSEAKAYSPVVNEGTG